MYDVKAADYDSFRKPGVKEANWSFCHPFRTVLSLETRSVCPRDKKETARPRAAKSLRICPKVCLKRLREDTRQDSAVRRPRSTTKLETNELAPRQTNVKEWE